MPSVPFFHILANTCYSQRELLRVYIHEFIYFSSWLCCPLWLQDSPQTRLESVSWCLETSFFFKIPFLGQISVPTSFVSLFIFYILSYLLSKTRGCFSGCLMSSASIHIALSHRQVPSFYSLKRLPFQEYILLLGLCLLPGSPGQRARKRM